MCALSSSGAEGTESKFWGFWFRGWERWFFTAQIDETALHAREIAQTEPPTKSTPRFSVAALGTVRLLGRKDVLPVNSQVPFFQPYSSNTHFSSTFFHPYFLTIHSIFTSLNLSVSALHLCLSFFFFFHTLWRIVSSCVHLDFMPRGLKGSQLGHTQLPSALRFQLPEI